MCAPMKMRTLDMMFQGVLEYAEQYKKFEGKSNEEIEVQLTSIREAGMPGLKDLQQLVMQVRGEVDMIYAPLLVVQATHDEVIDPDSANIIYNEAQSHTKYIKWYDESRHVITLDKERDQLHEDIYQFLEQLDWSV